LKFSVIFFLIVVKNPFNWLKRRFAAEADTSRGPSIRIPYTHPKWGAAFGEVITDEDRKFAVKREPIDFRSVFVVAHDIFDNWFEVKDLAEKPDETLDRKVQVALLGLRVKEVFTQMSIFERCYGWAIIVVGYEDEGETLEDPVKNPKKIEELWPYAPPEISSIQEDRDEKSNRYGYPEYYYIKKLGMARRLKVHHSRVLHFATRLLDDHYKGLPLTDVIWDDLACWRNIRWALARTLYRFGSGFADITMETATQQKIDDFKLSEQFQDVHVGTLFVHGPDKKLQFLGVQGAALDPEPYCKPIMESLSCGTTIPLSILRGAQAGTLTGSEVNEREYCKIISDAQSDFEWGIRFVIEKLMEFSQIEGVEGKRDFEVDWLGGFELNERDKAAAEFDRARTRVLQTNYMTLDEVRAKDGYDPLPDGRGNVVLGLMRLQTATELGVPYEREKREEEK